jgi:osmotically-inducible protein OsmY
VATVFTVAACASDNPGRGPAERAGQVVDDSMITAKVKSAFVADKEVSALNIGVNTNNGVVQLTGKGSPEEARKATEIARNVAGVRAVQNNIQR